MKSDMDFEEDEPLEPPEDMHIQEEETAVATADAPVGPVKSSISVLPRMDIQAASPESVRPPPMEVVVISDDEEDDENVDPVFMRAEAAAGCNARESPVGHDESSAAVLTKSRADGRNDRAASPGRLVIDTSLRVEARKREPGYFRTTTRTPSFLSKKSLAQGPTDREIEAFESDYSAFRRRYDKDTKEYEDTNLMSNRNASLDTRFRNELAWLRCLNRVKKQLNDASKFNETFAKQQPVGAKLHGDHALLDMSNACAQLKLRQIVLEHPDLMESALRELCKQRHTEWKGLHDDAFKYQIEDARNVLRSKGRLTGRDDPYYCRGTKEVEVLVRCKG